MHNTDERYFVISDASGKSRYFIRNPEREIDWDKVATAVATVETMGAPIDLFQAMNATESLDGLPLLTEVDIDSSRMGILESEFFSEVKYVLPANLTCVVFESKASTLRNLTRYILGDTKVYPDDPHLWRYVDNLDLHINKPSRYMQTYGREYRWERETISDSNPSMDIKFR